MNSSRPVADKKSANMQANLPIRNNRSGSTSDLPGPVRDLADLLAQIVADQYRKQEVTAATTQQGGEHD